LSSLFLFTARATSQLYPLSLHDALPIYYRPQSQQRVLMDDIQGGIDELGVLLMGHPRGGYWFGSQLSIEEARRLAPYNNATTLRSEGTRLNSSHVKISYAVFCLKKKKKR